MRLATEAERDRYRSGIPSRYELVSPWPLTDVDAVAQEKLLAHLADCQECRDEYAKLSDGVQTS